MIAYFPRMYFPDCDILIIEKLKHIEGQMRHGMLEKWKAVPTVTILCKEA